MEEFLNKLYSYEYFGTYLVISIVVLILLFFVILFFGKKDQREREKTATLKLQQINNDAFKEESIIEQVEVPNITQEILENDTIIVPNIGDMSGVVEEVSDEIPEPVLPNIEESIQSVPEEKADEASVVETPILEPVLDMPIVEPTAEIEIQSVVEEKEDEITPLLEKIEEKPLLFNEFNINYEVPKIEAINESPKPNESTEIQSELEVPIFNFDEIVKDVEETKKEQTYTKGPEIFSSVYVPKKEEVELPKVDIPEVKEPVNNDLDFELPTLKKDVVAEPKEEPVEEVKEEKIEMPVLNDYNLDSILGETYNINK
ncbi:MAG: hypothetical protein E7161_00595 [Firmicutes bacterium]|nr:hypothetical protein [Bacillota bacterium]